MAAGGELTRDHQLFQIGNAAGVAVLEREIVQRYLAGAITGEQFVVAGSGAEFIGYRNAVTATERYMLAHRAVEAPELLDVGLVPAEFDLAGAMNRVMSTLAALDRVRELDRPQYEIDRVFARIVGNYATWAAGAVQRASRDMIIASCDAASSRWRRVSDGNPCAFCAMLAGRGPVYRSRESAAGVVGHTHRNKSGLVYSGRKRGTRSIGERYHNNCVIGSTIVDGPPSEVAMRRWYEGEVVVIRVADGQELTITPNHPVLTTRGWVPAGELNEVDQVLTGTRAEWAHLDIPHEDDGPTRIQDVWGSSRMRALGAMPVSPEDFHGDGSGSKSEVDVVLPNGEFPHVVDTVRVEHYGKPIFPWTLAPDGPIALASEGLGVQLTQRGRASAESCLSCGSLGSSLIWGHGRGDQAGSLTGSANRDTGLDESSLDGWARRVQRLGQSLDGLAGLVSAYDLGAINVGPRRAGHPRFDPVAAENVADRRRVYADLGRDLAHRLSGGVRAQRIVGLIRTRWSGHVYNLQTAEGWYSANRIIVSNCGCTVEEVTGTWTPTAEEQRFVDLYADARAKCEADGVPANVENVTRAMRELGDGIVHDAVKPKTQVGGSDSGGPPTPRTKISDGDRYPDDQDGKPIPFRPSQVIGLDESLEHILHGDPGYRSGGHLYSTVVENMFEGKIAFPESWTEQRIEQVCWSVIRGATRVISRGQRFLLTATVDDVQVTVQVIHRATGPVVRTAHPDGGVGVMRVHDGALSPVALESSA